MFPNGRLKLSRRHPGPLEALLRPPGGPDRPDMSPDRRVAWAPYDDKDVKGKGLWIYASGIDDTMFGLVLESFPEINYWR
jgi:hypothetical protein